MPRAKKATEKTAEAVTPKAVTKTSAPKATKPRAVKKAPTASPSKQVADLERRLDETEEKLNILISVIHSDLERGQRTGPEGLASKLRKAGLLP